MDGLKQLVKPTGSVYFGHPLPFWQHRRGNQQQHLFSQVEEYQHLKAVVSHGATVQQRQILRRVESKVQEELSLVERDIEKKRQRLRALLEHDEEAYIQELATREAMLECEACVGWNSKLQRYEEELEREKIAECQRALEHEKIARGMQSNKLDEAELRNMQRQQMIEKQHIESAERERDRMWHQVLLEDWRQKELHATREREKREREMRETRHIYDEQIATATRKRAEAIQKERERANHEIEEVKLRMEKDREKDLRIKKERQNSIKQYHEEEQSLKLRKQAKDKMEERAIDVAHIRRCQVELQRERQRQIDNMARLQVEKSVFLQHYHAERRAATAMEEDTARASEEQQAEAQRKADEELMKQEQIREKTKLEAANLYRKHQQTVAAALDHARLERSKMAVRVRETAIEEVRKNMRKTEKEIERQSQYRHSLHAQIRNSQDTMRQEKQKNEKQLLPFVAKPKTFKDVMLSKVDQSPGLPSTLPVHPFARVMTKLPTSNLEASIF